jgi:hypothetical protein
MSFKEEQVFIIGFTGKAGSGKSSVAEATTAKVFSFARSLKDIAKFLGWDGKKEYKGRQLLQQLGDVGREYNPNIWIENLERDMRDQLMDDKYYGDISIYGIDDVRFDNEGKFIKDNGGIIIELLCDKTNINKKLDKHISEQGLSKEYINYTIPWDKLDKVVKTAGIIIEEEYNQRFNTPRAS